MAFQIIRNNIVNVEADAIVNTANPLVDVGAGVDEAIYTAAGWDRLFADREMIGEMRPGDVAHTPAYDLDAKYIIHTIGPAWLGGDHGEREAVARCYRDSLKLADELGCGSIAFPLIATGTYGFPKDEALKIAVAEISDFLLGHEMEVMLVVYDRESFEVSGKLFDGIRAYIDEDEADYVPHSGRRRRISEFLSRKEIFHIEQDAEDEQQMYENVQAPSIDFAATAIEVESDDIEVEEFESEDMEDWSDGLGVKESYNARYDSYTAPADDLKERLDHMDKTFREYLFMLIDRKGLKDSEVYKKANIDRRLFSKIRSNKDYKPSKMTALALAVALELNIDQTRDLLKTAGYALSGSDRFDKIIEYCIETEEYDIYEINCILFNYKQPLLGA